MKKVFLLATAALLVGTATFAEGGKGKKKKKAKTCCSKSATKTCSGESKTAKM